MKRIAWTILLVLLVAGVAGAISGDIDADGDVDFDDFFLLADNFGKSGQPVKPETTRVTVYDTVRVVLPRSDPVPSQQITVASFNVRIFSTGSRTDAELSQIADRLQQFDLVAVQEVRDTIVVARTLAILAQRGLVYRAETSAPLGRDASSMERYVFLYRPDQISLTKAGVVYPDPQDKFIREPFIASFQSGQFDFTLVTIHVLFGDTVSGRRAEASLLDDVYTAVQGEDLKEQDVILMGDFNLPPEDDGFVEMRTTLAALIWGNLRTTISDASLYDNMWFDPQYVQEFTGLRGIDRYDETVFANNDDAASLAVSDHRPIWAKFRTSGRDDD